MLRSLREVFEALCVADIMDWIDAPEESDFIPRSIEDEIQEIFLSEAESRKEKGR